MTYLPANQTIEFDPAKLPYSGNGKPGSILDAALNFGVDLNHVCGGNAACTTCRVLIIEGQKNLSEQEDDELNALDMVADPPPNLRLGCQSLVLGDVTVEIPPED